MADRLVTCSHVQQNPQVRRERLGTEHGVFRGVVVRVRV